MKDPSVMITGSGMCFPNIPSFSINSVVSLNFEVSYQDATSIEIRITKKGLLGFAKALD